MTAPRDLAAEARAMADRISGMRVRESIALLARDLMTEMAAEIESLRADLDKVRAHIDQRPEYITACTNAGPDSAHDYYRWQGGAEARRQLAQKLDWTVPHKPGETTAPKDGES